MKENENLKLKLNDDGLLMLNYNTVLDENTKLKDMMGGGGGSFVLRGSDLVLALNRSETSLNLRRGS